jgi:hypothetical protein
MTKEQKIIRAKVVARQLGHVSQACKMMGYVVRGR